VIRDLSNEKLKLIDESDKALMEFYFNADEFVCMLYTDKPIIVFRKVDNLFIKDYE